jgi:hypothetical protein
MKRVVAMVLCVVLGACSSFEVTGPGADLPLEFSARAAQHGQWLEVPVMEAEGQPGRITVNARLSTPDPCRVLSGDLRGEGSKLVLAVAVRPNGSEGCYQVIGTFEYDAVIPGLRPGNYHLQVVHTYPGTGWPTSTVLDRQVQVR